MPITARPLLLCLSTLVLASATTTPAAQIVLRDPPQSLNCPVTLIAELRPESRLRPASLREGDTVRSSVHIRLSSPADQTDDRQIRSAEIVLHGDSLTRGAQPAAAGSPTTEITRSFHIASDPSRPGALSADLSLTGVTGISRVTLASVDFISAPAWHTSKSSSCVTVPTSSRFLSSLR